MSENVAVLHEWAQFGRTHPLRRLSPPDWSAVNRMIIAAEPYLREEATTLRDLLLEWSDKFRMQDPLLNDLGLHRWIDKETSYSDWLAWVLERLEPSAVFEILDVPPPCNRENTGKCQVQRESQLGSRYIDLLIRFDSVPHYAIGVEVKTYDEQYAKQKDYLKSLRSRYGKDMECRLIAIREDIVEDSGFRLRPWRKVTFTLREKIAEYATQHTEDRIVTAMMLGFVAAAEQNLLGFSPAAPRRVTMYQPALIPAELVNYLRGDKWEIF